MARNREVYDDSRCELNGEGDFDKGSDAGGVGERGPAGGAQPEAEAVRVARSGIAGTGVFVSRRFHAGDWIMSFAEGFPEAVSYGETVNNPEHEESHYVQVGADLYIYPSTPSLYLNHSCNPNTGVRDGTEIIALVEIDAGDELTFDYSTSMAEDAWEMDCACGAEDCRRRIRDFKYLPPRRRLYYIELGVVGDFCIESGSAAKIL